MQKLTVWLVVTFLALGIGSGLREKMTAFQAIKTRLVFPYQLHALLRGHRFKFLAYVQRVFPNTARHAGYINIRHISRPDLRIVLGLGPRVAV